MVSRVTFITQLQSPNSGRGEHDDEVVHGEWECEGQTREMENEVDLRWWRSDDRDCGETARL